jgi:hypothetical protein
MQLNLQELRGVSLKHGHAEVAEKQDLTQRSEKKDRALFTNIADAQGSLFYPPFEQKSVHAETRRFPLFNCHGPRKRATQMKATSDPRYDVKSA